MSGAPFDVKFISFADIQADPSILKDIDVLINVGDADTAHTGGRWWEEPTVAAAIKQFVWNGGGIIGVGEPGGHQYQGRFLQLASVLGVEKETGFTLNYDKYNWEEHRDHFILADCPEHTVDFGEGKRASTPWRMPRCWCSRTRKCRWPCTATARAAAYTSAACLTALSTTVCCTARSCGPATASEQLHTWFSENCNVEVHAYVKNGKYCVVNNTYQPQDTTVYRGDGSSFALHLEANEIKWYEI